MKSPAVANHKERRIVTWTPEEDDILREQIRIHGTLNWSTIASNFNDKTTRQCRRRWFTYLNTDFKKGGWTPEEDMLLCETQQRFGNRWTEIAKVVTGRTDNAVKNRFTTLCKKRARNQPLTKENKAPYINNSFRYPASTTLKRMRLTQIPNIPTSSNFGDVSCAKGMQQLRPPFTNLGQNSRKFDNAQENLIDVYAGNRKTEGTFLKKDDPKVFALVQQAELLSSMAMKVNTENTKEILDTATEALEKFLNEEMDNEVLNCDIDDLDFEFDDDISNLMEEMMSMENSQGQSDMYDSPSSSEYSSESSIFSSNHIELTQDDIRTMLNDDDDDETMLQTIDTTAENTKSIETTNQDNVLVPSAEENNKGEASAFLTEVFSSPLKVTPMFSSFEDRIPLPSFSYSEKHYLKETFGLESPDPSQSNSPAQPPPCRRALVHSL